MVEHVSEGDVSEEDVSAGDVSTGDVSAGDVSAGDRAVPILSALSDRPHPVSKILLVGVEILLALLLGLSLIALGLGGGAWILGGIGAGALAFALYRRRLHPLAQTNRSARRFGQILIGLTAGLAVQQRDLATLLPQVPLFVVLSLFLLGSGVGVAYLYRRLQQLDWVTAVLATTPGNIGVMASIAADYGKNPALVSLVQLLRFTAVIFVVPLLIHPGDGGAAGLSAGSPLSGVTATLASWVQELAQSQIQDWLLLSLILGLVAAVIPLGRALKIPVAAFFCAIIVGLVFNGLLQVGLSVLLPVLPIDLVKDWHLDVMTDATMSFQLPTVVNVLGQILLGITIGEYWISNPRLDRKTIVYASVPVLLTFVTGLGAAAIAHQVTDWDWLTCLLVTAPGGSPEMIWLAAALDRNVEIVTAGHLLRILLINLLLPGLMAVATIWDGGDRGIAPTT